MIKKTIKNTKNKKTIKNTKNKKTIKNTKNKKPKTIKLFLFFKFDIKGKPNQNYSDSIQILKQTG